MRQHLLQPLWLARAGHESGLSFPLQLRARTRTRSRTRTRARTRPPCPRRLRPCRRPLLVRPARLRTWLWAWTLASWRWPPPFRSSTGTGAQTRAWPRMRWAPARRPRFVTILAARWVALSHGDFLPAKPDLGRATAAGERDAISRQPVVLSCEVHLKGLTGPLDSARHNRC